MPRKKWGRARTRRQRKKRKWRQQKLAIGTVQKIAKQIAKREDQKQLKKYVHVSYIKNANYDWHRYPMALPVVTNWQLSTGGGALYNKIISNVGGFIQDANMTQQDAAERGQVELRVHGMQAFGILTNNSIYPCRVEVRLIFIPNANAYTTTPNAYLTPRITMLSKSGHGVNGLTYRGYDKRSLSALDATGVPIKYQELGRRVVYLPARNYIGTYGVPGNPPTTQPINISSPLVYKRWSISKYFKTPRKAHCRSGEDDLSDGNYYIIYWSDGATNQQTFSHLATANFQYSLKSVMNDDTAP